MDIFWGKTGWELEDRHLAKMRSQPFERPFPFMPKDPGLYVIRGPRQVGKSSWLKLILSHYVKADKKCFYLSCEEVENFKGLIEILRSIRGYDVILLDEISFVEEWARAIKFAIDSGWTKILVVTGSHAFDLKLGADRLPGRFDGGGEFSLLPMDFEEFCSARMAAGWSQQNRLEDVRAYFRVGGFPSAVAESGPEGILPQKTIQTYWRWLVGDAVKLGKSEEQLTELMIQLAIVIQNPVSYTTLAKKANFGSHNTAAEYIGILESCFALRTLYAVDIDTGALRTRKDRKFYFTDPLLYWLAESLSGKKFDQNPEPKLAEMVANEHLARRYKRFGYYATKLGEVDFILPKRWALEVKWSPVATNLSKAYLNLELAEKIVWTQNNVLSDWPRLQSTENSVFSK